MGADSAEKLKFGGGFRGVYLLLKQTSLTPGPSPGGRGESKQWWPARWMRAPRYLSFVVKTVKTLSHFCGLIPAHV